MLHRALASLLALRILFADPKLVVTPVTIRTPYHVKNGATNAKSTTFTTKATAVLAGLQAGLQGGIQLKAFQLVPYAMANMESGSASFSFDSGYSGGIQPIRDGVVDIQPFSFYTVGTDLIYTPWNLSVGTFLQQAKSNKTQNGYKLVTFQLSWHFRSS